MPCSRPSCSSRSGGTRCNVSPPTRPARSVPLKLSSRCLQGGETSMLKHGLLAIVITAMATTALAEAQAKKGANGGTVVTSQGHPIEFVLKGQELVFYVGDHDGSPLPTKDMRGRATVQDGDRKGVV